MNSGCFDHDLILFNSQSIVVTVIELQFDA